jgi:hypothetical protein
MAVVTPETFDFVLTNELKRARRSQNFVTLVLIEPRGDDPAEGCRDIVRLIDPELRETDLLAVEDTAVSIVLLDADLQNSMGVIDRVMARLEHYQFSSPLDIQVGAACCPTHGADADTLRRVAAEARTGVTRREPPRGSAHA